MIDDIYFKMHCLYNAKTELYDRSLTDKMGLEILLGRYSAEQTEVLRKINRDDSFAMHEFENRHGFSKAGEKMDPKYDFLPNEEEMDEYISESLGRLLGNGE